MNVTHALAYTSVHIPKPGLSHKASPLQKAAAQRLVSVNKHEGYPNHIVMTTLPAQPLEPCNPGSEHHAHQLWPKGSSAPRTQRYSDPTGGSSGCAYQPP